MLFRKKQEVIDPYTVEQCISCNATKKRRFVQGDFIFKTLDTCTSCNEGRMMIMKIFGQVVK